ncbi:MAG: hypothetical protein IPL35_08980 [Sphingobacteriales bacterium]|nr:hypothetical protein [Sphingobacteriales bacterium]
MLSYSKVQILDLMRKNNISHSTKSNLYDILADLAPIGYNLISQHNYKSVYILLGQSNANGGGINGDNLNATLPDHLKRPMSGV